MQQLHRKNFNPLSHLNRAQFWKSCELKGSWLNISRSTRFPILTVARAHVSLPPARFATGKSSVLDVIHDVTVFARHHAFITKDIRIQLSASWWCHIASGGYAEGTTFDSWFLDEKRKEPLSFERKGGVTLKREILLLGLQSCFQISRVQILQKRIRKRFWTRLRPYLTGVIRFMDVNWNQVEQKVTDLNT